MVFMLGSVIEEHTFLTKDVLPMRLGDIRIVFTPFSKLDLILLVSCVLSVKLSPSTDTPNTNVFSINHCFADKCSENCKSSQLCGPQSCELFYCFGRLGLFEDLGGVVLGVHLGDDVGDGALLIYDVGLAQGAHADLAVVLLLAPGLVGLQDDRVRVGYQGEGQGVFFYEFPVRGHAVLADSHHGVALAEESFIVVPKVTGLCGAAGSAVLGIEVEDESSSCKITQADDVAVLVRALEVRGFVSFLKHSSLIEYIIFQYLVLYLLFWKQHTLDRLGHALLRHCPRYPHSRIFQNSPLSIEWHNEVFYHA